MRSAEDIERYLFELELPCSRVSDAMWVLQDIGGHLENVVVYQTGSVLNFRVKLAEVPAGNHEELFRRLLELNATQMVHGAYGLENDNLVLIGALEVENIDLNEMRAMLDSFSMAIAGHHDVLQHWLAPGAEA